MALLIWNDTEKINWIQLVQPHRGERRGLLAQLRELLRQRRCLCSRRLGLRFRRALGLLQRRLELLDNLFAHGEALAQRRRVARAGAVRGGVRSATGSIRRFACAVAFSSLCSSQAAELVLQPLCSGARCI
jgi:hypothetical protein